MRAPRSIEAGRARALLAAGALTLLSACGNDNDPGPGGVTVGEARALDEAAEMLDAQRLPEDAVPAASEAAAPETAETTSAAPE